MQTVITIHGIKTRGKWQKDISPFLQKFVHEPLDFGNFLAIQLALSKSRNAKVEFFRDEYTRITRSDPFPSVIAHSFGTYIVAEAMERYPEIRFDRIIFCGSIVSDEYDWDAVKDQFTSVLNDCGRRDFWSWIARFIVNDAGQSGVTGFKRTVGGRVENRIHSKFRHSDYFYKLNYEKQWVPFLCGDQLKPLSENDRRPINWAFLVIRGLLLLVLIALVYWLYGKFKCIDLPWDGIPGPMVEPSVSEVLLPSRDRVFTQARFPSAQVKLEIANNTGKNIVLLMFSCEFAFADRGSKDRSSSNGWHQLYLPDDGVDYVLHFPSEFGSYLFFAKSKCDDSPVPIRVLDIYQGRFPIVTIESDPSNRYVAKLTFGNEETEQ